MYHATYIIAVGYLIVSAAAAAQPNNGTQSPRSDVTLRQGLRSAATSNYVEPRLRTKFGERAFSFAGPHAWNQLPTSLRTCDTAPELLQETT